MTFWKRQNCGAGKQISGHQGLGRGERFATKGQKGIWGFKEFIYIVVVVTQRCAFTKTPKKDGFSLYANCALSFKNLSVKKKQENI